MLTATFYTFSKRENSTLRPTSGGVVIPVALKVPSSIESPSLEIHSADIATYNYLYITEYARYYFITDRESIAKDTYIVTCRVDALASFKDEIAGQNVFAEYASYGYSEWLVDPRVQPSGVITTMLESKTLEIFNVTGGTPDTFEYCRVIAQNGVLNGYEVFMGVDTLRPLLNVLSDSNNLHTLLLDISGADPFSAICEIWESPLYMPNCHAQTALGNTTIWQVQIGGRRLLDPTCKSYYCIIDVPANAKYNDFRNDWISYQLFLPYVGVISLPTELMNNANSVIVTYAGDCTNGQIAYSVRIESTYLMNVGLYGANVKSANSMGRSQTDEGRWAAGAMSVVGAAVAAGAFTGNPVAAIGAAGAAEISTFIGMAAPGKRHEVGTFTGGIAACALNIDSTTIKLLIQKPGTITEPSHYTARYGRPVQKNVQIQAGFVKARNASVAISGTDSERAVINSYLNGGIYYE